MPEFIVDNQIIHYEIRGIEETKLKTPLLMLHGNGEDMHSRIVAEVTILLGKKDPCIDRKHSEAIADALPHCSHMLIDGAGHGIPTTHPRAVIDCIRTLL